MRIEVWKEHKEALPVKLALRNDAGGVAIVICDEQGQVISHLAAITPQGTIKRLFVNGLTQLGFKTDESGKVRIE